MRSTRVPRIYQLIATGDLEIAKDRRGTLILVSSLRDVVAGDSSGRGSWIPTAPLSGEIRRDTRSYSGHIPAKSP
jgi:hypothetical protein